MKHLTLSLLVVILERAQNAAECLSCQSNSVVTLEHTNAQSETTLLQQFREEILKGLPDVKTVISLRQNLAGSNAKEDLQEGAVCRSLMAIWTNTKKKNTWCSYTSDIFLCESCDITSCRFVLVWMWSLRGFAYFKLILLNSVSWLVHSSTFFPL